MLQWTNKTFSQKRRENINESTNGICWAWGCHAHSSFELHQGLSEFIGNIKTLVEKSCHVKRLKLFMPKLGCMIQSCSIMNKLLTFHCITEERSNTSCSIHKLSIGKFGLCIVPIQDRQKKQVPRSNSVITALRSKVIGENMSRWWSRWNEGLDCGCEGPCIVTAGTIHLNRFNQLSAPPSCWQWKIIIQTNGAICTWEAVMSQSLFDSCMIAKSIKEDSTSVPCLHNGFLGSPSPQVFLLQ